MGLIKLEQPDPMAKLRASLDIFYQDFIWSREDPHIRKPGGIYNFIEEYTFFKNKEEFEDGVKFVKNHILNDDYDVLSSTWVQKYPNHYITPKPGHIKMFLKGAKDIHGFWAEAYNILLLVAQISESDTSSHAVSTKTFLTTKEYLNALVHEYSHTADRLDTRSTRLEYKHHDWFTDAYSDGDGGTLWIKILHKFEDAKRGSQLFDVSWDRAGKSYYEKGLYYGKKALGIIESNNMMRADGSILLDEKNTDILSTKLRDLGMPNIHFINTIIVESEQAILDGFIAEHIIKEIISRFITDVALEQHSSREWHYEDLERHLPGHKELLSPKLIERIKDRAWPGLDIKMKKQMNVFSAIVVE